MEDYTGNSKKDREEKDKPPKKVERVVTGKVLIPKKTMGQKFKDLFIATDLKGVGRFVVYDICIPAFQNMLVDSVSKGVERMTYGERTRRRGGPSGYVSYQSPVNRGFIRDNLDRTGLPVRQPTTIRPQRAQLNNDPILTKEDAELVLERMTDIVDQYQVVTVGDLNALLNLPSTHVDEKWGWDSVAEIQIRQVREGYLLDLPQPLPLQ